MPTRSGNRKWSREEAILVLSLYCRIPFAKSSKAHPQVIQVAKLIRRTPSAVNLRIGNFGSFDPRLREKGIVGLKNTGALVKNIWDEFQDDWKKLAFEAHRIENDMRKARSSEIVQPIFGEDAMRMAKKRINQDFFRQVILASYGEKCCITGIDSEKLLIASHIKPWARCGRMEKLNPRNGLCLNALHDRAFDRGLITVDSRYRIRISKELSASSNPALKKWLIGFDRKQINLPEKFAPDPAFLEWHASNIFLDKRVI